MSQSEFEVYLYSEEHWQKYLDHVSDGAEYDEQLDSFRWMIEEFRVSLFAQRLGTVEKVSEKRLKDAWLKVTSGG